MSAAVRLQGPCDPELLQQSIRDVISRHESLRTSFGSIDGRPVQKISAPAGDWKLQQVNLTTLTEPDQAAEVQRLARQHASRPFDLAQAPLIRASLLALGDSRHVLLLTLHHIICDGWSIRVFNQEVTRIYQAKSTGAQPQLERLEYQFADFAAWQLDWLEAGCAEQQFAHWNNVLGDHPPAIDLPTDRPRPPVQTFHGDCLRRQLPEEVANALQALAREQKATLFMVLLAAWQALLSRYTGQDDICVGSPIANRKEPQWEKLIGFFANTLVFRTDLSGDPSFRELVDRVKEVTLDAYDNQDVPFEKLVERLGVPREPSRTPLFQVMFVMQNIPVTVAEVEGLSIRDVELGNQRATEFDLTLNVDQRDDGLDLLLMYNTDLFDKATAARLLGCYLTLVDGILTNPAAAISTIPILDAAQIEQQVDAWNNTQVDYPGDQRIHDLLVDQAARTPDAPAVVSLAQPSADSAASGGLTSFDSSDPVASLDSHAPTALTYAQLDRYSEQLAAYLATLGVVPDMPVGFFLANLADQLVAIYGILKAGGAFVPLDPSFPADRIATMVEDAGLALIVTESALSDTLPAGRHRSVCSIRIRI